jgi:cytochrome c oxidase subunit 3
MSEQHGSYYVPHHSSLPIIGAVGLFLTAGGSLNFSESWGPIAFGVGMVIFLGMLFSWFRAVIKESRQGLYSAQMDRTFRWGMAWFLFCELCFFGTLLGALIYVRWVSLPWMAGQSGAISSASLMTHYVLWPNFQNVWPLLKNPAPYLFGGLKHVPSAMGIPALNALVLVVSSLLGMFALSSSKKGNNGLALTGLLIAMLLGALFLVLQLHYGAYVMTQYGLKISSGIYGSLFYMILGFHALHVLVGVILLLTILIRSALGHFAPGQNHFAFDAAVWYWVFVTVVWLFILAFLFGF